MRGAPAGSDLGARREERMSMYIGKIERCLETSFELVFTVLDRELFRSVGGATGARRIGRE